jgi:hypothetical protein
MVDKQDHIMSYLPEEMIRKVLSYRSLPTTRSYSRSLDQIESDLLEERVDNIKKSYTYIYDKI